MGCRRYFVVDRLEALVDEGDSRSSSRVREHESFLFHYCMWQFRHSEVKVYFLALCEQTDGMFTQRVSPFLLDLRLRFRLRLCLNLNV